MAAASGRKPGTLAWTNGTLCHQLNFDDVGFTHPSVCTVPAVLAIGERQQSSGADLITAMAVAYEVFARLIRSFRFYDCQLKKRGVHTMSVCGTLAAAAGAGKMLKLDRDKLLVATGLAASSSIGLLSTSVPGESQLTRETPPAPARSAPCSRSSATRRAERPCRDIPACSTRC
ncbi:MmgE/PrpD family protein [Pseudochelatococcus sp. B33]